MICQMDLMGLLRQKYSLGFVLDNGYMRTTKRVITLLENIDMKNGQTV